MATLSKRSDRRWQTQVRKANQSITKTFINKIDIEHWAKQVQIQKGSDPTQHSLVSWVG